MDLIGVTGATGRVGSRVARQLADAGLEQRLIVRDPSRAPELPGATVAQATYDEPGEALAGVHTLLMVSAAEHPDRVGQHLRFLDAAKAAGVEHVVYTSFLAAAPDSTFTLGRHHWATEEHLRGLGVRWTFLRDSLYADFLPLMAGEDGVIRGPAGDGRVGAVAIDDVADVAVTVLKDPGSHVGQAYDLTGPRTVSLAEVAALLSAQGTPTTFHDETEQEAYASRAVYGAPAFEVEGWVTSYLAIRDGSLDRVTGDVERLTGHPARALEDLLSS
jgi:NAD(P)H dehydrogenase (quinone)